MWHASPLYSGAGPCDCYLCRSPSFISSNKPPLNAYLPPLTTRAPLEHAYYVVAVSGGAVLSKKPDGILNCEAVNSETQRWRVEYGGDDDDDEGQIRVALMNVFDGKWLRAAGGAAYGYVDTSEEKQWWVLEEGISPGSCWLKCADFPDSYLCNANGSFVDGNATYTRPKQLDRAYALTWTLRDADAVGYDAKGWRLSVCPDKDDITVMLEEREAIVSQRETRLQSLEEQIAAREATQAKQAKDLAVRGEMQTKQAESLETREAALAKQATGLETREVALANRNADLEVREVALVRQTAEFEAMVSQLEKPCDHSTEISLLKADNDNLHLQLRTGSLEREVEQVRQRSNSTSHTEQLNMLETEKARLRVLLHAEQQKGRTSPSPRRSNDFPSVFNSPSSLATRPTKDSRNSIFGQTSRPGSSSGLTVRPASAVPSLAATPKSSLRSFDQSSPSTPTRTSKGILSSTQGTQRSYDSRFSGFQEEDFAYPNTPTKSSKRASSTNLPTTPLANTSQTRLSKESLASTKSIKQRAAIEQKQQATPLGSATSTTYAPSVPSSTGGGKFTSKSTPARSKPPRMATLQYGAPAGLLPVSDDGDAVVYSCGHKVYKPPRKLNKTVVGYLYE